MSFLLVSAAYRDVIFANFCKQLLLINLAGCSDFELCQLQSCTELKELIINGCQFSPTSAPIEADKLFPKLKKLVKVGCHSLSSQFIEIPIPTLTELYMWCAHFGITSNLNWEDLPRLWPNLQVLDLFLPCKSLSVVKLRQIALQLPDLKLIRVPVTMLQSQEEKWLADELVAELEDLPSSIILKFEKIPEKHSGAMCAVHNGQ